MTARKTLVGVLLLLASSQAVRAQETNAVVINLARDATVDDVIVSLDQIAKLSGGTAAQRKRLSRLDVTDFALAMSQKTLTSAHVRFRLLLAGFGPADFKLTGSPRTVIFESDLPVTRRMILAAAEEAVRSRYAGEPSRVTIRAHGGFALPELDGIRSRNVRLSAAVKGPVPASGFAQVDVSVLVAGRLHEVAPVQVELVELFPAKPAPSVRQAVHFTPVAEKPIVIKTRDTVKLVAYIGSVRIVAGGEALQDGRAGQMIRVRNLTSSETVIGRIEADGIVVVDQ